MRKVVMICLLALTFIVAGLPAAALDSWPEYRGPWCNGLAQGPGDTAPLDLPVTWSETEHIVWKTAIPYKGWSTPVILEGQLWMTAATEDGHDSYAICVDAKSGEMLFEKHLFHTENPEPLGNAVNCYAAPSPVLEAGRVYVHFGTYGTACLDTKTAEALWERRDLPCRHFRGPGSSPILFEHLLVLTFDGIDVQYLAALDKTTGETVWRADRSTDWQDLDANGEPTRGGDYRKSFSTPVVIQVNGAPQLISQGAEGMFSYDPHTGKEIWKTHHMSHSASPRPLFDGKRLYATTGHGGAALWAIRPDGTGDVTDTHVDWRVKGRIVPEEPSPVLLDGLIYMVSNDGIASCHDAANGEAVWTERIGGGYMASPVCADGLLYSASTQGKTTVLKTGRTAEVVAVNELEDGCLASPAIAGHAIYLRTKTHLYRIEGK